MPKGPLNIYLSIDTESWPLAPAAEVTKMETSGQNQNQTKPPRIKPTTTVNQ